jgi:hypothetical protein
VETVAKAGGTIAYEILTGISGRVRARILSGVMACTKFIRPEEFPHDAVPRFIIGHEFYRMEFSIDYYSAIY